MVSSTASTCLSLFEKYPVLKNNLALAWRMAGMLHKNDHGKQSELKNNLGLENGRGMLHKNDVESRVKTNYASKVEN